MPKMPENAEKFICEICDFSCSKYSNYTTHLLTAKHNFLNTLEQKNAAYKYNCKYFINEIENYIPNIRDLIWSDIPLEHKNNLFENKTSKFRGVCYIPDKKYFQAAISYNKNILYLGVYPKNDHIIF